MKKLFLILLGLTLSVAAEDNPAKDLFGSAKAPDSQFPGEYEGVYISDGQETKYGLQIFALGGGKFKAVGFNGGLPGAGFEKGGKIEVVEGKAVKVKKGERIVFQNDDEEAIATLRKGRLVAREAGELIARMKKVQRAEPMLLQ